MSCYYSKYYGGLDYGLGGLGCNYGCGYGFLRGLAAATVLAMVAMDMAATARVTMEDTGPVASTEKPCTQPST